MNGQPDIDATGAFDARYVAFLETITHLRPKLHRYCSRMTGSVMDGEALHQAMHRGNVTDARRAAGRAALATRASG